MSKGVKILIGVVVAIIVGVLIYFFTKKKKQVSPVYSPGILPKPEARNNNTVADVANGSDPDLRYTPPPSAAIIPNITPSPTGTVAAPVANTTVSATASVYSSPTTRDVYTAPVKDTTTATAPVASFADPIPADGVNVLEPSRTVSTI